MHKFLSIFIIAIIGLSIFAILPAPSMAASGTSVMVLSKSPSDTNTTLYVPLNSTGQTALPLLTFNFTGSGSFSVVFNGSVINAGYVTTTYEFNHTASPGTYNISIRFGTSSYYVNSLHVVGGITSQPFQDVYISSTLTATQPLQLYAPANSIGLLMYPTWNITLISSAPVAYSVIVNGLEASSGTFSGIKNVVVVVNSSLGSAVVGIGDQVYKFSNMPIESVPLSQVYKSPSATLIYSQVFFTVFQVKTVISAVMSLVVAVFVVGGITKSQKEREIG